MLRQHMVNVQRLPHGEVIFSIADITFDAACSSHGELALALHMSIAYPAAAPADGRLDAEAREVKQGRRAGFFDVTVTDEAGTLVAKVHAIAHRTGRLVWLT